MRPLSKSRQVTRRYAVPISLRKILNAVSRQNRIVLMFSVCSGVAVIGILVLRDMRAANAEAREMYTRSVHGLRSIAEMQFEAQETRRSTLYALTTTDSNLQVQYADQSRDADQLVKNGIKEFRERAATPYEQELGTRLENEWTAYLRVRDEVLASILEGSIPEAVRMDLSKGVPAFERVRQDLLEVQRLYDQDASRRQANLAITSKWSSIKLIGILGSTFLVASLAVIVIQRNRAMNAIQLTKLQMEFVASMSHELRTPLAVLNLAADNLADGVVQAPDAVARYGGIVRRQSRNMSEMVDRILMFASTEDRNLHQVLEPLNVSSTVEELLNPLETRIHDAGFSMKKEIEPGLPPVLANRVAMGQCLNSLIDNAIKYSGTSREIEVRAVAAPAANPSVPELQITVSDRGTGIDASDMPRIFDPFYRSPRVQAAQIHGTGLGLSLARRMAESMGGTLTARSEPGRGSTFTLHLAFAAEQSAAPTEQLMGEPGEAPRGKKYSSRGR
jgi:signal transduction histidine kinase